MPLKTNIALVSLYDSFTNKLSDALAWELGLYYANVQDIMAYEIINPSEIEQKCGLEYLNKLKDKSFCAIMEYENSCIALPFAQYSNKSNYKLVSKNALTIFIKMPYALYERFFKGKKNKDIVSAIAFEDRNKFCQKHADIVLEVSNTATKLNINKIKKQILSYYSK